jgi:hypothetical protein
VDFVGEVGSRGRWSISSTRDGLTSTNFAESSSMFFLVISSSKDGRALSRGRPRPSICNESSPMSLIGMVEIPKMALVQSSPKAKPFLLIRYKFREETASCFLIRHPQHPNISLYPTDLSCDTVYYWIVRDEGGQFLTWAHRLATMLSLWWAKPSHAEARIRDLYISKPETSMYQDAQLE